MNEIRAWEKATNDIVTIFIKRFFDAKDVSWIANHSITKDGSEFTAKDKDGDYFYGYWIGEEIGGCLEVADYFFSFNRIKEALELKAKKRQVFGFFHLELERYGKVGYSFRNYVRYGKKQMDKLIKKTK